MCRPTKVPVCGSAAPFLRPLAPCSHPISLSPPPPIIPDPLLSLYTSEMRRPLLIWASSSYAPAKGLVALGHRLGRARDGIGHVEVGDTRGERRGGERFRRVRVLECERRKLRRGGLDAHAQRVGEVRRDGRHSLTDAANGVVRQRFAEQLRERDEDLPIVARVTRRVERARGALHASLRVDVGARLFGVGRARQDEVGGLCASVPVVALVYDEGARLQLLERHLVRAEQVDELERRERTRGRARHEADVERARGAARRLEDAVPVPALRQAASRLGDLLGGGGDGGSVRPRNRPGAE
mmetsp:Transcript_19869/g.63356  ORF Transcript_19869/g.63356 Transcript_19869/m.63356 type:complete len:298 (-) Transcript_19869:1477-2370(-)